MSTLIIIMVISFVIMAVVLFLTLLQTKKAYDVLPSLKDVDPIPEEHLTTEKRDLSS